MNKSKKRENLMAKIEMHSLSTTITIDYYISKATLNMWVDGKDKNAFLIDHSHYRL